MDEFLLDVTKDLLRHDNNLKYLYNGLQKTKKAVLRVDSRVTTLSLGLLCLGYCVYKQHKRIDKLEKKISSDVQFAEVNKKG